MHEVFEAKLDLMYKEWNFLNEKYKGVEERYLGVEERFKVINENMKLSPLLKLQSKLVIMNFSIANSGYNELKIFKF